MAKAKKSEKSAGGATEGGAKKKSPAKIAKPATPPAAPLIDTSLAAQTAARMIGARAAGALPAAEGEAGESSLFKQLKQNVAKPHAASVESLLNTTNTSASQKSAVPFSSGGKQVGHNQTFGADVSRRNLPRRTGG